MDTAVEEERLLTHFTDAPRVTMKAIDRAAEAMIAYDSSLIGTDGLNWETILRFKGVTDFWFNDDPGDAEERLVEITDSKFVGPRRGLHHYRIAFGGHGVYDVVGKEMDVMADRVAHQ